MHVYSGVAQPVPGGNDLFQQVDSSVKVWWRGVLCDGNEANIAFCEFQLNTGSCSHSQDAGVLCLGDAVSTVSSSTVTPKASTTTTVQPRICNKNTSHRL